MSTSGSEFLEISKSFNKEYKRLKQTSPTTFEELSILRFIPNAIKRKNVADIDSLLWQASSTLKTQGYSNNPNIDGSFMMFIESLRNDYSEIERMKVQFSILIIYSLLLITFSLLILINIGSINSFFYFYLSSFFLLVIFFIQVYFYLMEFDFLEFVQKIFGLMKRQ